MSARRFARTVLPLTAAALVLAGCSSQDGATELDNTVPAVDFTSELSHLHGLYVDADGTVLAGTHTGLFALDSSGTPARVGTSDDDFMGLTGIPVSDTLFASGHPGQSSTAANPLGLRSSTDGGKSWAERSFAGQVDFHTLAADESTMVGFDGTDGLLVSTDGGSTWTPGATLPATSLAVTTSGIWAIAGQGVQHSTDGARVFSTVTDAPALVMLAGAGDALWGIDNDGYAWRSREGADWQRLARVGQVAALTAKDYETAYAATPTSLYTLSQP
ncbi:F510_1955 family glycosylhydrolase [Rhodococcus marinonascens]|uniref:F510_1955 family glycosylhydrolase n=1 Tax=Rhodococcus marinonascens TaxID=38311 RepID=UPI000934B637|nr:glycosyl hydrolase [Rhodococcus marinonascens]